MMEDEDFLKRCQLKQPQVMLRLEVLCVCACVCLFSLEEFGNVCVRMCECVCVSKGQPQSSSL